MCFFLIFVATQGTVLSSDLSATLWDLLVWFSEKGLRTLYSLGLKNSSQSPLNQQGTAKRDKNAEYTIGSNQSTNLSPGHKMS